jgi:drug/metabolite transporter superfamily protein YnfA
MTGSFSFGRKGRVTTLLVSTILAELAGIYLALLSLSRVHSPWLWLVVALDTSLCVLLLKLQRSGNHTIFAVYGAIFFAAVAAWF